MEIWNIISLTISSFLLAFYHFNFLYNLIQKPENCLSGWNQQIKKRWVLETSKKKGGDILAVQTLRNWILASTFLATVSITISFGLLSFIVQIARVQNPQGDSLIYQLINDPLITIKTIIIISCNFISFFAFSQSIRYFNHVGFAMSVPFKDHHQDLDNEDGVYESVHHVAEMLVTGSKFFTLGMRAFYVSIPFVFWYFGPVSLLVSTICTLVFMHAGDSSLEAHKVLKKAGDV